MAPGMQPQETAGARIGPVRYHGRVHNLAIAISVKRRIQHLTMVQVKFLAQATEDKTAIVTRMDEADLTPSDMTVLCTRLNLLKVCPPLLIFGSSAYDCGCRQFSMVG